MLNELRGGFRSGVLKKNIFHVDSLTDVRLKNLMVHPLKRSIHPLRFMFYFNRILKGGRFPNVS